MQIEIGWTVHVSECSTVAADCNSATQIEMRGGTVDHFPAPQRPLHHLTQSGAHGVELQHREGPVRQEHGDPALVLAARLPDGKI